MNKHRSKDKLPVKRKSGWARLNETNRYKLLSSITQDKTNVNLTLNLNQIYS